ncbi:lysylphosphatidylglycerol synthase transmembrane domain-containing protein [Bradyrhizobium genosp. P]|uniref:lysylphosphatidylglycerol synthase transmembrane domain-containing protein n=1 Tax=Bradyrhizobium genosp. P TaxID=83641 RepID=UPI003CEB2D95
MTQGFVRGTVAVCIKIAVTVSLLWFLVSHVDLHHISNALTSLSLASLGLAAFVLALTIPANAARWHYILSASGSSPGLAKLAKILLVGLFFNQVLPSGVGGDAVRVWRCHLLGIPAGQAIRSVLLDRAMGFASIVLVYAAGLPILLRMMADRLQQGVFVAIFVLAVGGLAALFSLDFLPSFLLRVKFLSPLASISIEGRRLVSDPRRLGVIFSLALLGTAINIYAYQRIAQSMGADLSFVDWVLVVPPVTLVQLLPISLAGWGIREAALVVVLSAFNIPSEIALTISLLFGACQILIALPGGLIWITGWDLDAGSRSGNEDLTLGIPAFPAKPSVAEVGS